MTLGIKTLKNNFIRYWWFQSVRLMETQSSKAVKRPKEESDEDDEPLSSR